MDQYDGLLEFANNGKPRAVTDTARDPYQALDDFATGGMGDQRLEAARGREALAQQPGPVKGFIQGAAHAPSGLGNLWNDATKSEDDLDIDPEVWFDSGYWMLNYPGLKPEEYPTGSKPIPATPENTKRLGEILDKHYPGAARKFRDTLDPEAAHKRRLDATWGGDWDKRPREGTTPQQPQAPVTVREYALGFSDRRLMSSDDVTRSLHPGQALPANLDYAYPPYERPQAPTEDPLPIERGALGEINAGSVRGVAQLKRGVGGMKKLFGFDTEGDEDIRNAERDLEKFRPSSSVARGFQPRSVRWWMAKAPEQAVNLAASATMAAATGGQSSIAQFLAFASPTVVQEGGNTYVDALKYWRSKGLGEDEAKSRARVEGLAAGIGNGLLEMAPFNEIVGHPKLLGVFDKWLSGRVPQMAKRFLAGGIAEGSTEVAQDFWSTTVSGDPTMAENPTMRRIEAFVLAAMTGGVMNAAVGSRIPTGEQSVGQELGNMLPSPPEAADVQPVEGAEGVFQPKETPDEWLARSLPQQAQSQTLTQPLDVQPDLTVSKSLLLTRQGSRQWAEQNPEAAYELTSAAQATRSVFKRVKDVLPEGSFFTVTERQRFVDNLREETGAESIPSRPEYTGDRVGVMRPDDRTYAPPQGQRRSAVVEGMEGIPKPIPLITQIASPEEPVSVEQKETDFSSMSNDEIDRMAMSLGVKTRGLSRKGIVKRIQQAQQRKQAAEGVPGTAQKPETTPRPPRPEKAPQRPPQPAPAPQTKSTVPTPQAPAAVSPSYKRPFTPQEPKPAPRVEGDDLTRMDWNALRTEAKRLKVRGVTRPQIEQGIREARARADAAANYLLPRTRAVLGDDVYELTGYEDDGTQILARNVTTGEATSFRRPAWEAGVNLHRATPKEVETQILEGSRERAKKRLEEERNKPKEPPKPPEEPPPPAPAPKKPTPPKPAPAAPKAPAPPKPKPKANESVKSTVEGPAIARATGNEAGFVHPDASQEFPGTHALVALEDLQPSHIGAQPNPDYALGGAQNRSEIATKAGEYAQKFDPRFFVEKTIRSGGTIGIRPDGQVIFGNTRTNALLMAVKDPEKRARYVEAVKAAATTFGLTEDQVQAVVDDGKVPVIVRQFPNLTPEQTGEAGRLSNVRESAGLSPHEVAKTITDQASVDELVATLDLDRNDTMAQSLADSKFVNRFKRLLDKIGLSQESKEYFDGDKVSAKGKDTIPKILYHAVLGNEMIGDSNIADYILHAEPGLREKIDYALPDIWKLKNRVAKGKLDSDSDIQADLMDAIRVVSMADREGTSPEMVWVGMSQRDAFSDPSLPSLEEVSQRSRDMVITLLRPQKTALRTLVGDFARLSEDGGADMFLEGTIWDTAAIPHREWLQKALDVRRKKAEGKKKPDAEVILKGKRIVDPNPATMGSTAPYVATPAETKAGGRLLHRMAADSKRSGQKRVGMRSIVEYLADAVKTRLMVGKSQTTSRHPAHYNPYAHLIRSRSGSWQLNFHEIGHAISYLVSDARPLWFEKINQALLRFARKGSSSDVNMASSGSAEEGLAEVARLYVTNPGAIPDTLRNGFEQTLGDVAPDVLAGLRDAHRAYSAFRARPLAEQMETYRNDRPQRQSVGELTKDVAYRALYNIIGPAPVLWRIYRNAYYGFTGDRALRYLDPTGVVRLLKSVVVPMYRTQQKMARAFMASVKDTSADFMSAFQSTIHTMEEVYQAIGGSKSGHEGIRVRATGNGFGQFSKETVEALRDAGFIIPKASKHGDWIYLNDKSFSAIKHEVGLPNWELFQSYGQYRAALERWNKAQQDYPGRSEGMSPKVLREWIASVEAAHPDWSRHFRSVNQFMDQLLLVPVLTGELSFREAINIKAAWDSYWPLLRRVEGRAVSAASAGATPDSGIRSAFGSPLPFRSLDEAVEFRVKRALDAYYQNRLMNSMVDFAHQIGTQKDVPFEVRKSVSRLLAPLHLDLKKMATLSVREQQEMIADFMNKQMAEAMGVSVRKLPEDARVDPENIDIREPQSIWRRVRPNAINVVAPIRNGERVFYQVTDPLLFRMLSESRDPVKEVRTLSRLMMGITAPWKRALTQNLAFAAGNSLSRDPSMAGFMGEDGVKSLIPGYYAGVGILNRLRGDPLDAVSGSELLSKSLDHTTRDAHRGVVASFVDMLQEGIAVEGWRDMPWRERLLVELPGQALSTIMKPFDMVNWLTGGRAMSQLGEKLPREGAFVSARRRGESPERAQIAYDYVTGNFGHRSGNPNMASLIKIAGFLNPALQIMWGQAQRVSNPDPKAVAMQTAVKIPTLMAWGAAGAALNFLLMSAVYDDDDERKEVIARMKERTDKDRLSYLVLAGKVRLPFDYGVIGSAMSFGWNSTEEWMFDDPRDAKKKAEILLARARDLPGLTDAINPMLKTGAEVYLNHSFFFDDRIVPAWLEARYPYNPELQTWPSMPKVYDLIGKGLRVSPIKVRYAVRSIFTRQADDAIRTIEHFTGGEKIDEGSELPLVGRMIQADPRGNRSNSVLSLREIDDHYASLSSRLKTLETRGERDTALETARDRLTLAHDFMGNVESLWEAAKTAKDAGDVEGQRRAERRMTAAAKAFFEWQEGKRSKIPADAVSDDFLGRAVYRLTAPKPEIQKGESRETFDARVSDWEKSTARAWALLGNVDVSSEVLARTLRARETGSDGRPLKTVLNGKATAFGKRLQALRRWVATGSSTRNHVLPRSMGQ